jgi:hypothetical protein
MKPNLQLQSTLIRYPTIIECLGADAQLPTRQLHPRVPPAIAWSPQWVVAIPLTRAHLATPLGYRLHRAAAHMSLL